MAINSRLVKQTLTLIVKTGQKDNGTSILKNINLSRIRKDATDENLYRVAEAIEAILIYPVQAINKSATTDIVED